MSLGCQLVDVRGVGKAEGGECVFFAGIVCSEY